MDGHEGASEDHDILKDQGFCPPTAQATGSWFWSTELYWQWRLNGSIARSRIHTCRSEEAFAEEGYKTVLLPPWIFGSSAPSTFPVACERALA